MLPSNPQTPGPAQLAETHGRTKPESKHASKILLKWFALLTLLAAAVALLLVELDLHFQSAKNSLDFLAFYTAGTILRRGSAKQLYDVALQLGIEHHLMPQSIPMPYYHPPFEAWLFEGLSHLSLSGAFVLWTAINLAVLGLIFYLVRATGYRLDQDRRLIWVVAALPMVAGVLVKGQDSLLLALVFVLAFLALKKRYDVAAGLVLGAGLFRFEIILPFVFIFLLRRRWNLLAGFAASGAVWGMVSLVTVGWSGLLEYAGIILKVGHARGSTMAGDVAAMPSLRGAIASLFGSAIPGGFMFPLVLAGTLLLLAWAAWEFRSVSAPDTRAFDLEFSLAVIVAVIASYHLFVYMLTPLILVAFLVLGHECSGREQGMRMDRAGTILVLLLGLVPIVGSMFHFYHFTVLFFVMMGLAFWCAQENSLFGRKTL